MIFICVLLCYSRGQAYNLRTSHCFEQLRVFGHMIIVLRDKGLQPRVFITKVSGCTFNCIEIQCSTHVAEQIMPPAARNGQVANEMSRLQQVGKSLDCCSVSTPSYCLLA